MAEWATERSLIPTPSLFSQYTTPALFVAKAKLERQVIKLDKDVLELQVARSRRRGTCSTVTTRIKYALFLALVAMYWSMPLFEVRFIIREYHYRCLPPPSPPP
mmetsp:Transcript_76019/g.216989  ORF Transcript_76019/g.216989 Transcript_76019/m.216989 type:complete len:104 (+) Transcript_76019:524-835(+)